MLFVGAKGFAIQLTDAYLLNRLHSDLSSGADNLYYFDDVSTDLPEKFLGHFPILRSMAEAEQHFDERRAHDIAPLFALAVGNPRIRALLYDRMEAIGGISNIIIAQGATIGLYDVVIGEGSTILTGSVIESTVKMGKGCLVNLNVTLTHNMVCGDFCEFAPGVHISGEVGIGDRCFFGTGCVVLPHLRIGNDVVVGAGAVVTHHIEDGTTVVGVPAHNVEN